MTRCFPGQTAAGALAPGHQYLADRAESDVGDLELGAASMEEDDAVGGGGEGAGGSTGGGFGDCRMTMRKTSHTALLAPTEQAAVP